MLSVKGATGCVLEYFGEGVESLSCTGMATICNMGAEVGATSSIFPFTSATHRYLVATRRGTLAEEAFAFQKSTKFLSPDCGLWWRVVWRVLISGFENHLDSVVEIDLSSLEPHLSFSSSLSTVLIRLNNSRRTLLSRRIHALVKDEKSNGGKSVAGHNFCCIDRLVHEQQL